MLSEHQRGPIEQEGRPDTQERSEYREQATTEERDHAKHTAGQSGKHADWHSRDDTDSPPPPLEKQPSEEEMSAKLQQFIQEYRFLKVRHCRKKYRLVSLFVTP